MAPATAEEGDASSVPTTISDADLDKLLKQEESAFSKELEVERILKAFKLNPYDVLDISYMATTADIKKRYRQLSLFIHPDKTPHARAPEAFDLLKKAESELQDTDKRSELDAVITQARTLILKAHKLPPTTADDDERLLELELVPPMREQVRLKTKEMLIDEELRRRRAVKMNLANEGLERKMKEEEQSAKKRKAEHDAQWEENREVRVDSWRSFQSGAKKTKKKKLNVLG